MTVSMSAKLIVASALLMAPPVLLAQSSGFVPRGGGGPELTPEEFCQRAGCVLAPADRQIVNPTGGSAGTPSLADGGTGIRWFYNSDPFPASGPGTGRGIVTRTQYLTASQSAPAVLYNFEFHPPLGSNSMHFSLQVQSSFVAGLAAINTPACQSSLTPSGRTMALFLRARLQRVDVASPIVDLRQGDIGQVQTLLPYTAYPTRHYTNFVPIVSAFDPVSGSYPRYRLWVESWAVPGNTGDNSNPFSIECFVPANPNLINIGLAITSTQMMLTF